MPKAGCNWIRNGEAGGDGGGPGGGGTGKGGGWTCFGGGTGGGVTCGVLLRLIPPVTVRTRVANALRVSGPTMPSTELSLKSLWKRSTASLVSFPKIPSSVSGPKPCPRAALRFCCSRRTSSPRLPNLSVSAIARHPFFIRRIVHRRGHALQFKNRLPADIPVTSSNVRCQFPCMLTIANA